MFDMYNDAIAPRPPESLMSVGGGSSDTSNSRAYALLEQMAEDYEQHEALDRLGEFVMNAASSAVQHKNSTGVQGRMEAAKRAMNLEYGPCDMALMDDGAAIYMGITALKVRAFRSWVSDILLNAEDKPYTLKASPIPDLPPAVEDLIIDKFIQEVASAGVTDTIVARLSEMKQIARSHVETVTQESAAALETVVHDQLTEGGWREAFDEFIDDLGAMPGAVLKGPFVEYKTVMKWSNGRATQVRKPVYRMKRVSPFDLFPAADCRDAQSGSYIVERTRMNQSQLMSASRLRGFKEAAIRHVVATNEGGWSWMDAGASHGRDDADEVDAIIGGAGASSGKPTDTSQNYDVLIYNGFVRGDALCDWNVGKLDPHMAYDMEVWVVDGIAIRAIMNPNPLGKRPYYVTALDKIAGSFWGRGLADLLDDVQRVGNACVRALVKNMALASGPIGEYDVNRFAGEEDLTEVQPFRLFAVNTDEFSQTTQAAFRFHNINSNARELMEIYERFMKQADDISGIPAYTLGNPNVAGAGRTLGGLSLLMGNAAKGIKKVISQVDKDVIEPMVSQYVSLNLLFNPREDIKFDTEVIARGSSGLLQRELMQSRAVELLTLLAPFAQPGPDGESLVPKEGIQMVLRDAIRGLGYRADEVVPQPNRKAMIKDALARIGAGAIDPNQSATIPGTPAPALDGRSAPPAFPSEGIPGL